MPTCHSGRVDSFDDRTPVASVVVPAHQEERTLGRCLEALLGDDLSDSAQVVVVANGCTDDTAQVARRYPVRVLELAVGNKSAALDAGDAACTALPRVYVDADVVLDRQSLQALVAALDVAQPLLATPRAHLDVSSAGLVVRAYWRAWQRLQQVRGDHLGCGVYAVNAAGRARWGRFPDGVADDYHVHTLFSPRERVQVLAARSVVRPPQTLRSLLAVRTRVYAGMDEHHAARGRLERPRRRLRPLLSDPLAVLALPVYVVVTLEAKRRAAARAGTGALEWARDESGRTPTGQGRGKA